MNKKSFCAAIKKCAVEPKHKFKNGVHARFLDLGNGWGAKYFLHEKQRDENYDLQSVLSQHSLAPNVGVKFKFKRSDQEMFGFFTEVVIPYEDYHADILYSEESDELAYGIAQELREEIQDVGLNVYDLHEGNIGWSDKLNRWVVIDVSIDTCDFNSRWDKHMWDGIE